MMLAEWPSNEARATEARVRLQILTQQGVKPRWHWTMIVVIPLQVTFAGFVIVSTLNYFLVSLIMLGCARHRRPSLCPACSRQPRCTVSPLATRMRQWAALTLLSTCRDHWQSHPELNEPHVQIYNLGIDVEESPISR